MTLMERKKGEKRRREESGMNDTRSLIIDRLQAVEREKNVAILYAIESGSRAWGFPSADSDYDVRFIYTRCKEDYLSIADPPDTLDFAVEGDLDVSGWDIRKTLRQIKRSNAVVFEWLQSPIVYRERSGFRESLLETAAAFYSPRAALHHYLGIYKNYTEALSPDGDVKIKKLFYLLRTLFAAFWAHEKDGPPPMTFSELENALPDPGSFSSFTAPLIEKKAVTAESNSIRIPAELKERIKRFSTVCLEPKDFRGPEAEAGLLDDFFRKTIGE